MGLHTNLYRKHGSPERPIPQHAVGKGSCGLCASTSLPKCRVCGQRTIHTVGANTRFSEQVCENRCALSAAALFRLEMKAALERVH